MADRIDSGGGGDATEDALREQLLYYRLGAVEYDDANLALLGRNDDDGRRRRAGYGRAIALLDKLAKNRDVLEVAGGTGMYTRHLATIASRVTVVEASPESIEISQASTLHAAAKVRYVLSDIFAWTPPRRFDVVIFAFWLSHVPHSRFDTFWRMVDQALAPGGTVVIVDAAATEQEAQPVPVAQNFFSEQRVNDECSIRQLADGSQFRVIRILWTSINLREKLGSLGWECEFDDTPSWLIGTARRM